MFAVPGWSVSASLLKTQSEPIPSKAGNAVANGPAGKSKKRKRGKDKAAEVTDENVSELWQKHVGKTPTDTPSTELKAAVEPPPEQMSERKQAKERKKQKLERLEAAGLEGQVPDSSVKPSKPVKRQEGEARLDDESAEPAIVEKKVKKGKKERNKEKQRQPSNGEAPPAQAAKAASASAPPAAPSLPPATKLTPMQSAMRQKLVSARFRHLNQTLYTAPSTTSLALFATNPEMFADYHSGFRQQVAVWPSNPVDAFLRTIQARGKVKPPGFFKDRKQKRKAEEEPEAPGPLQPLPRTQGTCTIADLGCGDARLAAELAASGAAKKCNVRMLSYDLASTSPLVTKADVAKLPLADGSVDVAVFCLALMGTNWIDFVEEAYRVLHWKGELWIAEIKSRFGRVGGDKGKGRVVEHSVGSKRKDAAKKKGLDTEQKRKDEQDEEEALKVEVDGVETGPQEQTDVGAFVEVLRRRGFVLRDDNAVDARNRMFVSMEFVKAASPLVGKNVRAAEERGGKNDEQSTWKRKQSLKFLDNATKEVSVEDEAKVLKPCLYKIR